VANDFDGWLAETFASEVTGKAFARDASGAVLHEVRLPRLIAFLYCLSGHAPDPLPAGELEAIRARAEGAAEGPWDSGRGDGRSATVSGPNGLGISVALPGEFYSAWKDTAEFVAHARADVPALLAALDSALADLAAAEGALADLTSPESPDGNRAYLRGVEDERRRCVERLRVAVTLLREKAAARPADSEAAYVWREQADALDAAARALESPPAPAAAPKESGR
jgi:hypothetical protein